MAIYKLCTYHFVQYFGYSCKQNTEHFLSYGETKKQHERMKKNYDCDAQKPTITTYGKAYVNDRIMANLYNDFSAYFNRFILKIGDILEADGATYLIDSVDEAVEKNLLKHIDSHYACGIYKKYLHWKTWDAYKKIDRYKNHFRPYVVNLSNDTGVVSYLLVPLSGIMGIDEWREEELEKK